MYKKMIIFALLPTLLAGCIYSPRDIKVTPELSGMVFAQQKPVADVAMSLNEGKSCATEVLGSSRADGSFEIPARVKRVNVASFGDALYEAQLCLNVAGQWRLGFEASQLGGFYTSYELACELDAAATATEPLCKVVKATFD